MAPNKHWIWYAYLALADRGGMTEPEGRTLLKETFPTFAHMVDSVVANHGDRSKLAEDLIRKTDDVADNAEREVNSESMNAIIRDSLRRKETAERIPRENGRFVASDRSGVQGFTNSDPANDMNSAIRGIATKNRTTVER